MAKGFGRAKRRREKLELSMDRLADLNAMVPWVIFGDILNQLERKERKSNAGRKPIERLLLFKMLIILFGRLCDSQVARARTQYIALLTLMPRLESPFPALSTPKRPIA